MEFSAAQLRNDKPRQVIRLVNPRRFPISFDLKVVAPGTSTLKVNPSEGSIDTRGYKHIEVLNSDPKSVNSNPACLQLNYWANRDSSKKRHKASVPIYLVGSSDERDHNHKWLQIMIFSVRSVFLLALVIYNIALIIQFSFSKR